MFKIGDEVVVKQVTTPGCKEFFEWADECLKRQTPLVIADVPYQGERGFLWFNDCEWCLYTRDVEHLPIMENE